MKKPLVAVLALVVAGALFPANAFAAQTRSLPDGETLYAIDCDFSTGVLVSLNTQDATATAIGEGSTHGSIGCAANAAYDPHSGLAYWGSWRTRPTTLFSMDVATGASTYIGILDETTYDLSGLMMGEDGVLYAVYQTTEAGDQHTFLGSVNTENADITLIAELQLDGSDVGRSIWSTAYNPADGEFYVNAGGVLNRVNVTTGELTALGVNGDERWWNGMTFDSDGTLWGVGSNHVASTTIAGWATAGTETWTDENLLLDGSEWYAVSVFVAYGMTTPAEPEEPAIEAELAETGLDTASILGFAVAMFGGAAAVTVARRRARR